jgi:hypothetical protein
MIGELIIVIPHQDIAKYIQELRREFSFFTGSFDLNTLKVVTVPWIEAFIEKESKKIKNYEVNPEDHIIPEIMPVSNTNERFFENSKTNNDTKVLQKFLKKQEQDIEEHIEKLRREPDIQKKFFLMDANISMHNVHEKDDRVEITRLINVCGAFIYDTFIPGITTHIISQIPDKELIIKAGSLDNSSGPFIVTKQWLIDSIILGKREDEKLYMPPNIEQINNS